MDGVSCEVFTDKFQNDVLSVFRNLQEPDNSIKILNFHGDSIPSCEG